MNVLKSALTVTLVATVSCISGVMLGSANAMQRGINDDEAEKYGFNQPDGPPDLTAARGLLQGTVLADLIPAQKKGAKPDVKAAVAAKDALVYFLSVKHREKLYELKNRVACAIGCLGYVKLAGGIIEKQMKPVRLIEDGDTLVVITPPRSYAFKHEAQKVGLKMSYHGDGKDPKFAAYTPYTNKTTGEVMTHVRTAPVTERAKLETALTEAFKGRILVHDGSKGPTFRLIG